MKIEATAVHTVHGFRIQLNDDDAQHFNKRYTVATTNDGPEGQLRIIIAPAKSAGVRPGAPRNRQKNPTPVRYMQFGNLETEGLPYFAAAPCTIEDTGEDEFTLTLPREDDLQPPIEYKRGPDRAGPRHPEPNPDPIPTPAPSDKHPLPDIFNRETVKARVSLRDAVHRVNAFLAECDEAEPEIIKVEGCKKLRISVVEIYE